MRSKYLSRNQAKAVQWHTILGIVPFAWLLLFLSILAVGTFKLGYVPAYGNRIDPGDLHINLLLVIHAVCLVLAVFAVIGWMILSFILYSFYKGYSMFNKITWRLFIIGITGFFIFKYLFPGTFAWVLN
jgi:hypothetical protein